MKRQLKEIKIPFGANDSELCSWEYIIPEGMEATIVDNKIVVKKKKSEDEKIRDEIIIYLGAKEDISLNIHNRWLAWLEKQKSIDVLDKEEREFADNVDSYRKDMDEFYKKGYNAGREAEKQYWLGKQGEQKPVEWSEEDEYTLGETIQHLEELIRIDKAKYCGVDVQYYQRDIDWLKSLKERVQPQPKQEWSEEDEKIYKSITYSFAHNYPLTVQQQEFVKSLRPQNTWKPSDEQMERLKGTINSLPHQEVLYSLYQDLLKLKG